MDQQQLEVVRTYLAEVQIRIQDINSVVAVEFEADIVAGVAVALEPEKVGTVDNR